jgi:hypothetical protein
MRFSTFFLDDGDTSGGLGGAGVGVGSVVALSPPPHVPDGHIAVYGMACTLRYGDAGEAPSASSKGAGVPAITLPTANGPLVSLAVSFRSSQDTTSDLFRRFHDCFNYLHSVQSTQPHEDGSCSHSRGIANSSE